MRILILIGVIYASAHGFLFSLRFALGTEFPAVIVKGNSMVPTYYDGELIIVQGVADKNTIEPLRDIIVFHGPYDWDTLIVHRVVEKRSIDDQLIFFTKGDNNPSRDSWRVQEEHIVGIVLRKIPYMGEVVTAIQSPYGVGTLYGLIIIIVLIDFFYYKE